MAKVTKKQPHPKRRMAPSTSGSKGRNMKARKQPRARSGRKVQMRIPNIRGSLPMRPTKKGSKNTTKPKRKPNRSGGTIRCSQDHRLHKTLNRKKPAQNKKKVKKSMTSRARALQRMH